MYRYFRYIIYVKYINYVFKLTYRNLSLFLIIV